MKHILYGLLLIPPLAFAHGSHDEEGEAYILNVANLYASVSITVEGNKKVIKANGIPRHDTGAFPNRGNPHSVREQRYSFEMPVKPTKKNTPQHFERGLFGVALNGVPFDPATAEFWRGDRSSGWNLDAFGGGMNLGIDMNNAHVQPSGAYHYHGKPTGLMRLLGASTNKMTLIGYGADGFPVYASLGTQDILKSSYKLKDGYRPSGGPSGRYDGTYVQDYEYVVGAGDLDICNGREGVTAEYPEGIYYYVVTSSFPFVPRCWVGEADRSFTAHSERRGERRRRGPEGRRPPPHHMVHPPPFGRF